MSEPNDLDDITLIVNHPSSVFTVNSLFLSFISCLFFRKNYGRLARQKSDFKKSPCKQTTFTFSFPFKLSFFLIHQFETFFVLFSAGCCYYGDSFPTSLYLSSWLAAVALCIYLCNEQRIALSSTATPYRNSWSSLRYERNVSLGTSTVEE